MTTLIKDWLIRNKWTRSKIDGEFTYSKTVTDGFEQAEFNAKLDGRDSKCALSVKFHAHFNVCHTVTSLATIGGQYGMTWALENLIEAVGRYHSRLKTKLYKRLLAKSQIDPMVLAEDGWKNKGGKLTRRVGKTYWIIDHWSEHSCRILVSYPNYHKRKIQGFSLMLTANWSANQRTVGWSIGRVEHPNAKTRSGFLIDATGGNKDLKFPINITWAFEKLIEAIDRNRPDITDDLTRKLIHSLRI